MRCAVIGHDLGLARPVATAAGPIGQRRVWVFTVDDGSGRIGLGEASPLPGFGGETPAKCAAALERALAALTDEVANAWFSRERPDAALGPKLENALRDAPCARHAVEGALLDLMAQRTNQCLSTLLAGGETPTSVPVNVLIEGQSFALLTRSRELLGHGFTTFKLKSSGDPKKDADRVRALREIVGPAGLLRLDANAAWTAAQATEFLDAARESELDYLEQPLAADDLAGHAALRKLGHRIGLDESVRIPGDVARIAAAQAADVVVLKPQFLGGWRATQQAAQLARSHGIDVVLSSVIDGAIGRANAAHMAAALGLTKRAHGLATGELIVREPVSGPLTVFGGSMHLSPASGLGVGLLR